jgi:hypothetical protein
MPLETADIIASAGAKFSVNLSSGTIQAAKIGDRDLTLGANSRSFMIDSAAAGDTFVLANFLPMLIFWLMNGAMLFWFSPGFRAVLTGLYSKGPIENSVWMGLFIIWTVITAFAVSALIPRVQALMEGKWWDWAVALFAPAEGRRLADIDDRIRGIARYRGDLNSRTDAWRGKLRASADAGNKNHSGKVWSAGLAAKLKGLDRLFADWKANRHLDVRDIDAAVKVLSEELSTYDHDAALPNGERPLETAFLRLDQLLQDAQVRADHEHIRLLTQRHFSFGTQNLAPTRMGNVANTLQSFAVNRYNLNLEVFWSRLQKSIAADKDFSAKLEGVRTKLEFLISGSLLTGVWGAAWSVICLIRGYDWQKFALAAVGGPLGAYLLYRIATEHYRTYADVIRSSIDLFRLGLIKDLHFPAPADVEEERDMWDRLNQLTSYYEVTNFRFDPKSLQ